MRKNKQQKLSDTLYTEMRKKFFISDIFLILCDKILCTQNPVLWPSLHHCDLLFQNKTSRLLFIEKFRSFVRENCTQRVRCYIYCHFFVLLVRSGTQDIDIVFLVVEALFSMCSLINFLFYSLLVKLCKNSGSLNLAVCGQARHTIVWNSCWNFVRVACWENFY